MNISHNKRVLWYTRGYIPDIIPRGCGGLAELRTGFNKNIPKSQTHTLTKLICWSISEYYCAFFGYINTLPLGLCLIDIVYFDNGGILLCLLWPYRYFAS
jgi:hypothetical protein